MKPILVHLHIYYPHLYDELKNCVLNIKPQQFDLFVTMVEEHKEIISDIKNTFPNAKIEIVENRGYDVGPFIHVLNQVNLDDYDYVVKLHTKRDVNDNGNTFREMKGNKWRKNLLTFVSSTEIFNQYLRAFDNNENLGMQNNLKLIVKKDCYDKNAVKQFNNFLDKHNLPKIKFSYVAGTMFIAKAKIFKEIKKLNVSLQDFPVTKAVSKTSQLAHSFERLFGYLVYKNNLVIEDGIISQTKQNNYHKYIFIKDCFIHPFLRFFYQKKVTKSEKLVIKICKIPVYRRKVVCK